MNNFGDRMKKNVKKSKLLIINEGILFKSYYNVGAYDLFIF